MRARSRISVRASSPPPAEAIAPAIVGNALTLGKQSVPLYAGALHYFRHTPDVWRTALEAVKSLGCTIVETYVPWGVHERQDGSFDFGEQDPSKDLGRFIDLAQAVGLFVFVRPGPNINAELTYFGLPRRIVFDVECQARSRRGQPLPMIAPPKMFPVPSYASERFLSETERWFAKVAEIVRPRVWPEGPVVLVQVDNEAAFYFRDAPYDQDHHPDALAKYATFLERRYGDLAALNAAYGSDFTTWEAIPQPERPPTTREAARRSLDSGAFQAELLAGALERMRDSLLGSFGNLPTVHNVPMGEAGLPTTLARLDQIVDVNGLDYYHLRGHLDHVRDRTLHLVGSVSSPFSPEMGMGAPPWFALRTDADSIETAICALAYGLRGMNLYMAVDRDRWYGAPFDENGRERPLASQARRLFAGMLRSEFHTLERKAVVGLMIPKEYRDLARSMHTLGAVSPSLLQLAGAGAGAACHRSDLGFAEPIQLVYPELIAGFAHALEHARVPYVYVESDADDARLESLRVLITPSYEFVSRSRWQRLVAFAASGGRVIHGPHQPALDHALRDGEFSPIERATLTSGRADEIAAIVQELAHELEIAPSFRPNEGLETTIHEDANGPRVVFVIRREASFVTAELQLPEPMTLLDVMTDERFEGEHSVRIPMDGASCRMLLCLRGSQPPARRKAPSARRSEVQSC